MVLPLADSDVGLVAKKARARPRRVQARTDKPVPDLQETKVLGRTLTRLNMGVGHDARPHPNHQILKINTGAAKTKKWRTEGSNP